MNVKREKRSFVIFENTLTNNDIIRELLTRPLFGMVVDRFIFKHNQIALSPCFTFAPKTGVGLPEAWVSFYCVL